MISDSCSVAQTVSVNRVSDAWVEANLGRESPSRARPNEPGRSRRAGCAEAQAERGWTSHGPRPGRAVHPGRDRASTTGPTGAEPFPPVPSDRPEAGPCREARRKTGRPGPNRVKNPIPLLALKVAAHPQGGRRSPITGQRHEKYQRDEEDPASACSLPHKNK
jgi:hypothetical protein